jgi:hypothetical protein
MDYYGSMSMPTKKDIIATFLYELNKTQFKFIKQDEIETIVNKIINKDVKITEYSYMSWCKIGIKLTKQKILNEINEYQNKKKQMMATVITCHHFLPSELLLEINNNL